MIKSDPIVSIIVPIYNAELYLTDTLQAVCNQTFTNFECICINDGSVDNTEKIIDEFVKKDKRFSKINQLNRGVSRARNAGLHVAKGAYVFFVDHDDLIPSDALRNLHEAAEKFNTDMSRGRMIMIPESFPLTEMPNNNRPSKEQIFSNPLTDFYRHARGKNSTWCYIWQCLFRRSAIENIRFVDDLRSGREDNLFMYEVITSIKNYVQLDSVVACHRHSKSSIMLSGYKPVQIKMFETSIPYIHQKYILTKNLDKRLVWWVYHKESYGVYRFLIRNTIRSGQQSLILIAREIFLKYHNTDALNEIMKRWGFRHRLFFWLFMKQQYSILRLSRIFM